MAIVLGSVTRDRTRQHLIWWSMTGIVGSDHVTWILASDWSRVKTWNMASD